MDIVTLAASHETLVNAFGRAIKTGTVKQVDKDKGYRLSYGTINGEEFLSPWLPHPESSKTSIPLKEGEIVGIVAPGGDPRQGFMLRGGYSEKHPSPASDMDANVFKDGGVVISIKDGVAHLEFPGGMRLKGDLTVDGNIVSNGTVTNKGKDIGSTHTNSGLPVD